MPEFDANLFPVFDQAYVISDLHLGGKDLDFQMFTSTKQFELLIDEILDSSRKLQKIKKGARTLLVINGDFVDLLAEPGATLFNWERAPQMVTELFIRDPFNRVMVSLQKYVAAHGTHLVITLGNHDLELALPAASRTLVKLLTDGHAEREGTVELRFDGWGYRFTVGTRSALCLHGNERDTYNFTRYDDLGRIIGELQHANHSAFAAQWRPSAGTWFVINAVNPVKATYPFVDLLKPEFPVMPMVLAILDPAMVFHLNEVQKMYREARHNDAVRPASERRFLDSNEIALLNAGDRTPRNMKWKEIVDTTERYLAEGNDKIDELIHLPEGETHLNWLGDAWNWINDHVDTVGRAMQTATADTKRRTKINGLKFALGRMLTDDPHDLAAMDENDVGINRGVRAGYDVVFAGHTHMRRFTDRPDTPGLYVNTGTWAGLMSFTKSFVASPDFEGAFDAMMSGSRQALFDKHLVREECTVARMIPGAKPDTATVSLGNVSTANGVDFPANISRQLEAPKGP